MLLETGSFNSNLLNHLLSKMDFLTLHTEQLLSPIFIRLFNSHNLNLKVVFLFQSFLALTVLVTQFVTSYVYKYIHIYLYILSF